MTKMNWGKRFHVGSKVVAVPFRTIQQPTGFRHCHAAMAVAPQWKKEIRTVKARQCRWGKPKVSLAPIHCFDTDEGND